MVKIIDLSRTIKEDMPVFPAYATPVIREWTKLELHGFRSNLLMVIEHTGTHVDSPAHFMERGLSIDDVPLERFYGRATMIDLHGLAADNKKFTVDEIRKAVSKAKVSVRGSIVLLYTGWEDMWGTDVYLKNPGLSKDSSEYLVRQKVKAVGIDAPSIDSGDSEDFPAHKVLLRAGIPVYENLSNLKALETPEFTFNAFPLKIERGSASPVRAVAIRE